MNKPILNNEYEVIIDNYTAEGKGVCRIFSYPIFIPLSVVGDKLIIKVTKDKKNYYEGEIVNIISPSENRINPKCIHYGLCGGCDIAHIDYENQLQLKKNTVCNALNKITKSNTIKVMETVNSKGFEEFYRNKAVFNFEIKENIIKSGFYKKKSYDIINLKECTILHKKINYLKEVVTEFCNEVNYLPLRLVLKYSFSQNEIMVCLVVNDRSFSYKRELINKLKDIKEVKSIIINYFSKNCVTLGNDSETIYGDDFITEDIDGIKFKNYLRSFFQVNPMQTRNLYGKAIELLELTKADTLLDLYCGVGTIGLISANKVKEVIGVEIVADAIKSCRENAVYNKIENAKFILGDTKDVFKKIRIVDKTNLKIIVDPPRKGLDKKVIENIAELSPKAIVYISCNEGTMARDLKIFNTFGYMTYEVTPFDMFTGSYHVETVMLLTKQNI